MSELLHSSAVDSTVHLQQEISGFESWPQSEILYVCVQSACVVRLPFSHAGCCVCCILSGQSRRSFKRGAVTWSRGQMGKHVRLVIRAVPRSPSEPSLIVNVPFLVFPLQPLLDSQESEPDHLCCSRISWSSTPSWSLDLLLHAAPLESPPVLDPHLHVGPWSAISVTLY